MPPGASADIICIIEFDRTFYGSTVLVFRSILNSIGTHADIIRKKKMMYTYSKKNDPRLSLSLADIICEDQKVSYLGIIREI